MNILDNIKNPSIVKSILEKINEEDFETISIMEVCGSHTMSIMKSGLKELLPKKVKLISGPGCPVCVTPQSFIDTAIMLSKRDNVIITTFGDLMRVPGAEGTLQNEKALGRDIRVVYSPLDSLQIAKDNPNKEIIFLAIGFETTAPIIALSVNDANKCNINNFSILNCLKTMPGAMTSLILDSELKIDGFLCPGHVATIIGTEPFNILAKENNIPLVIAGFETTDIISGIYKLIKLKSQNINYAENIYSRLVKEKGNIKAKDMINKVFKSCESQWRGLGSIKNTGLELREEYKIYDAVNKFNLQIVNIEIRKGCICGDVLRGVKEPKECKMFGKACTPSNPIGACMVSEEGTCAAYYKYN